jgi:hypothetical protein
LQATHETKTQLQKKKCSKGHQEKRDSWALKGKVGFQKCDKKESTKKHKEASENLYKLTWFQSSG